VCITFPINDDPRLQVDIGDEVLVTHWHKRWLYGQKMNSKDNGKIRPKGWFPERCSVMLVRPVSSNWDDDGEPSNHDDSKKNK